MKPNRAPSLYFQSLSFLKFNTKRQKKNKKNPVTKPNKN